MAQRWLEIVRKHAVRVGFHYPAAHAMKHGILPGGGEILPTVGASANGKPFNRELRMDCAVVAKCCRDANIETDEEEDSGPVFTVGARTGDSTSATRNSAKSAAVIAEPGLL